MPEVQNAADRKQVNAADKRIRRRTRRYFDALRKVMRTEEGRMVFGDREYGLLTRAGVFRSVFNTHGGIQQHNIGRQDFGHEMMALLIQADEELYELMDKECRARDRHDRAETEIAQSTEQQTSTTDEAE